MKETFPINTEPLKDNSESVMNEGSSGTPLLKENMLSEFSESEKKFARDNLGVYPKDVLMTSEEIIQYIAEKIAESILEHVSEGDAHDIQGKINESLSGYMKSDGSVGFTNRVKGVEPVENDDLSTKKYSDDNILLHEKKDDPHGTMAAVKELLKRYLLTDDAITLSNGYTRTQIDTMIKDFVLVTGERGFTKPILGKYPLVSSHISTKEYVDDVMSEHNLLSDPHGFKEYVSNAISNFLTSDDVYRKEETYSRVQINTKIEEMIEPVVTSVIRKHLLEDDPHGTLATVKAMNYVKNDGSVPFINPVQGVEGKNSKEFVTKSQLDKVEKKFDDLLNDEAVNNNKWTPSGPVQSTVGLVSKGTEFKDPMSLQQIIDAFFYGKSLSVNVKEYCSYGEIVDIEMVVRPTSMIDDVKLYQDEKLIGQYDASDFNDSGCKIIKSMPITSCSTFNMVVTFTNGSKCDDIDVCCVAYDVFVGAMPKWLSGSSTSIEYLNQLCSSDPINNKKFNYGPETCEYNIEYNFKSQNEPKSLFIAMPISYPSLLFMNTITQQFPANQFVSIDNIPYTMPDGSIVMYKLFIFPQGITEMNMNVVYKLNCNQ